MKPVIGVGLFAVLALASATSFLGPKTAKVKLTEWMRFESRTIRDGNSSQTEEASRSKWSLAIELPMAPETIQSFGPETGFEIKIGQTTFTGKLSDDPKYHAGATSATIPISAPKSSLSYATAKLKWGKDKVSFAFSPKSDTSPALTAREYLGANHGPFSQKTMLTVQMGDAKQAIDLLLTGKVDKKSVDTEMLSGAAIVIDYKGEGQVEVTP